jgi:glycerol-3-phosphate dehydrogenase
VVYLEIIKKEIIMLKLSDEALGAVMMALQKSLLEQSDIVPVLKGFNFQTNEKNELFVMNPPTFKMNHEDVDTLTDTDA